MQWQNIITDFFTINWAKIIVWSEMIFSAAKYSCIASKYLKETESISLSIFDSKNWLYYWIEFLSESTFISKHHEKQQCSVSNSSSCIKIRDDFFIHKFSDVYNLKSSVFSHLINSISDKDFWKSVAEWKSLICCLKSCALK